MPWEQNCAAISAKLAPIKISFTQEKKKVCLCMCAVGVIYVSREEYISKNTRLAGKRGLDYSVLLW